MDFCAIVCEYDPFHNGHAHLIAEARRLSGCEGVLCLMSGNFTQRGNAAVMQKYDRARHAVLGGADVVLELPAAFSVCPAELFARGAIHILSALPCVKTLAFGCEKGDRDRFLAAARMTLREDKAFRAALKENLKSGDAYPKARTDALLALHADLDGDLLLNPNSLLGVEYCRSILLESANIDPMPVMRVGGSFRDETLLPAFSSASALRAALPIGRGTRRLLKKNVPPSVYEDLLLFTPPPYEKAALLALLSHPETVADTPDCAEGLENRLLSLARANPDFCGLVDKTVSKRYTRARVKRVLLQNFLGVTKKETASFLSAPLYFRTLAVKRDRAEEIFRTLAEGRFPLVTRKSEALLLKKEAAACFARDLHANTLYDALLGRKSGDYETVFVDRPRSPLK